MARSAYAAAMPCIRRTPRCAWIWKASAARIAPMMLGVPPSSRASSSGCHLWLSCVTHATVPPPARAAGVRLERGVCVGAAPRAGHAGRA